MAKILKLFTITVTITVLCKFFTESCDVNTFVKNENMELRSHAVEKIQRLFPALCLARCQWLPWCLSINARKVHDYFYECELLNSTKTPDGLVAEVNSDFYQTEDAQEKICKLHGCMKSNNEKRKQPTTESRATGYTSTTTTSPSPISTRQSATSPAADPHCHLDFPRASKQDYVQVSLPSGVQFDKFTVSFWLRIPSSYGDMVRIFSYRYSGGQDYDMSVGIKSDGITEINVNGGGKSIQSRLQRDNTWQHFLITWRNNNGDVKLYKNGDLKSSETGLSPGEIVKGGGTMFIGQKHQTEGFDQTMVIQGSIAALEIWKSDAFTDHQIKSIFTTFQCKPVLLVLNEKVLTWQMVLNSPIRNGQVAKICPAIAVQGCIP